MVHILDTIHHNITRHMTYHTYTHNATQRAYINHTIYLKKGRAWWHPHTITL